MRSTTEVSLTEEDYNKLEDWFVKLFAKKNNPTKIDKFLYQKLIIMHDSYIREKNDLKDMMTEK